MDAEVRLMLEQALQQAIAALRAGEWPRAEQLSRLILEAQTDHFEALSVLGLVAARTGRRAEAASWLPRAVAANPGNAVAHNNYGQVLEELKRHEDALGSFERALEIRPDFAEASNNRGNALHELQRFDEALESYGRALTVQTRLCRGLQ